MPITREDILQACRRWLEATTPATLSQILVADPGTDSVRPDLPYVTVRLTSFGRPTSHDETLHRYDSGADQQYQFTAGMRAGLLTVVAYGDAAVDWLYEAQGGLGLDVTFDVFNPMGLTLLGSGTANNLSIVRDSSFESVFPMEFEIHYQNQTREFATDYITNVSNEITLSDDVHGDIVFTATASE